MPDQPVLEETVDEGLHAVQATALESVDRLIKGDPTVVMELAVQYIIPASLSLIVVFIGYLTAKYLARIVSSPICKRVDETLGKFIGRVIFYGIMLSVFAMVLNRIGLQMGGVATVLAAAGFAIGLAFQGTLSNFAAGVLLLVFRPFKVGDMINAAGIIPKRCHPPSAPSQNIPKRCHPPTRRRRSCRRPSKYPGNAGYLSIAVRN